ncbi:MAG: hypothetical protein RJA81_1136 [Planctomycetota bacterium]|jgi:RNA polymerase sigma-70 factor (ECF subfamily)
MNHDTFENLLKLARAGDEQAIGSLLKLFEREILLIVRHRLPRRLRSRYDSMDFVQSVYQSILMDWRENPPSDFHSETQLRSYLQATASNKVLEIYRRETRTQKYDIRREVAGLVRGASAQTGASIEPKAVDPASSDPTPSKHLQAEDLMQRLIRGRPAVVSEVVRLRAEGRTFEEIGRIVGLSDRSVRRMVDDLRQNATED